MNILINALGIQDSGGLKVLKKVLNECIKNDKYIYFIYVNNNVNIKKLSEKYRKFKELRFEIIEKSSFLYRLYYENFIFRNILKDKNIDLIYNFSGTAQPFLKTSQLIKIHNLLFYTKTLDDIYKREGKYIDWLKQVYLKRLVFKLMVQSSKYFEIQSLHVKEYMSDFININKKTFFIKSDIDVRDGEFYLPKKYDFRKKVKFLYIVGPHFTYRHKNFRDFTNTMLELSSLNIDFEINITLTHEQLNQSILWDARLNKITNFLGYIDSQKGMDKLFCDNTILISTSIIETLGLHVIEAIKKGVVPIVPSKKYSYSVYGENVVTYKLFNTKSLLKAIFSIIDGEINYEENIMMLQNDLKINENKKYKNIIEIFKEVKNVQK